MVSCEKSNMFSFASSIIRYIAVCSARFRFAVKWICWIAFGKTSSACYSLKSIAIIL